jgi:hypothetical protein
MTAEESGPPLKQQAKIMIFLARHNGTPAEDLKV